MEPIFIYFSHNCAPKASTAGESAVSGEEDVVDMQGR
jgi:hypothetical protein